MTRARISGECLKFMRGMYKDAEKELYTLDDFVEAIPTASRKDLSRALYALEDLGIVSVQSGDGEAYATVYDPDGLTKLIASKGADAVKDVIGWVVGLIQ